MIHASRGPKSYCRREAREGGASGPRCSNRRNLRDVAWCRAKSPSPQAAIRKGKDAPNPLSSFRS
jgi:hypothetical protein